MIYLASASPRRAQLLQQIGVEFSLVSADIDETRAGNETPRQYVERLAREKARAGWSKLGNQLTKDACVIGADTSVVQGDSILGKPADEQQALAMWQQLSGSVHEVMTAVCMKTATQEITMLDITRVWMRAVALAEWHALWRTGEAQDKAGGYAVQGYAARFITRIDGSYSTVVGLPLHCIDAMLRELHIERA